MLRGILNNGMTFEHVWLTFPKVSAARLALAMVYGSQDQCLT